MSVQDNSGPFSMFGGSQNETITAKNNEAPPKLYIAETTGMPPGWSDRLHEHITREAHRKAVPVIQVPGSEKDLKLVGHLSAAETSKGTVVAYIWDIKNNKGANLHRISGTKKLGQNGPRGPWSALGNETLRAVGEEAAINLQNWLTKRGYELSQTQIAEITNGQVATDSEAEAEKLAEAEAETKPIATPRVQIASPVIEPDNKVKVAALTSAPLPAPNKQNAFEKAQNQAEKTKETREKPTRQETRPVVRQVSAARAGPSSTSFVYLISVDGARGAGNSELTRAIISSLAKNGLGISPTPGPAGYKLEGLVKIEPSKDGKDKVSLRWRVKTADGTLIGTVSQKNNIEAGSFDKTWGQTAFLAADAAAGSIKTVIDRQQRLKI